MLHCHEADCHPRATRNRIGRRPNSEQIIITETGDGGALSITSQDDYRFIHAGIDGPKGIVGRSPLVNSNPRCYHRPRAGTPTISVPESGSHTVNNPCPERRTGSSSVRKQFNQFENTRPDRQALIIHCWGETAADVLGLVHTRSSGVPDGG